MITPRSSAGNSKGLRLGGALSSIVKESQISKDDLLGVFNDEGIRPSDTYSRQQVVRSGLTAATDQQAIAIATTLTDMLRKDGIFGSSNEDVVAKVEKLETTFAKLGASLSDAGEVTWDHGAVQPGQPATSVKPTWPAGQGPLVSGFIGNQPTVDESAPEPLLTRSRPLDKTVEDILNLLERLPSASHSLTKKRRKDRALVHITDEYDVQDFVFMALRLLYQPVVDEQPSFKKGGDGFNKGDFYLEGHKIMVEAKVAKSGHGVKAIKAEIAVDQAAYRNEDAVSALIVVIYDLDHTIADKEALKNFLEEDTKTSVVLKDWFGSKPEPEASEPGS